MQDNPRKPSRLLMLAGHYTPVAFIALAAMALADEATGRHPGLLRDITYVAGAAWLLSFYADEGYHSRGLCWRCARHAPANPDASVARWRRALWLHHKPGLVLLAGALPVAVLLLGSHFPRWLSVASDVCILVVAGSAFWSGIMHRRLRPWCPWCKPWDEGGDSEAVPDPEPDPAVAR